jgi:hypothetical protein
MIQELIEKLKLISRELDSHYTCTKDLSPTVAGKLDDDLSDIIDKLKEPRDMWLVMRTEDNGLIELDSIFDTEQAAKNRRDQLGENYFWTSVTYYP